MADKVFANGVFIKTQPTQYGDILKLSVRVEDFSAWLQANVSENGWISLDIMQKKEKDAKDRTHNMVLNTYVPAGQAQGEGGDGEDLPF